LLLVSDEAAGDESAVSSRAVSTNVEHWSFPIADRVCTWEVLQLQEGEMRVGCWRMQE
jgi:hypothetical protein